MKISITKITYHIKNWKLRFKEKFHPPYVLQILRTIKMLTIHPYKSTKQGMLKVMFGLTYECQCRCIYCCSGTYPILRDKELSKDQIFDILQQIASLPSIATVVDFFGGEPLLREDIYEIIKFANKLGLFTEVETNGILLTKNNVRKLKNAGLHHVFIRIESSSAQVHDGLSNYKGCFEKAIEGIKNCLKEGISCSISTIALKSKIHSGDLIKIIELGKKLGVTSIRILYPTLAGHWKEKFDQLLNKKEKKYVRNLLEPDFVYLESTYTASPDKDRMCPALKGKFFYISPYGELQPCPFIPIKLNDISQVKGLSKVKSLILRSCFLMSDKNYLSNCYKI
jgi:MoaA/NifB/PqqE/SkfB family radical SAM enzyme